MEWNLHPYLLHGPADDNPTRSKLYIGEADCVSTRLDRHHKELDWWEGLIVFTSKDENLNKAYVRHLEARLVEIAARAKRAQLANAQAPQPPRLSEADRADAEGFLENMLLIYPVLGIDAFEQPRKTAAPPTEVPLLVLQRKGTDATGRDLPEGFVVYAGSRDRRDSVPSVDQYVLAIRQQLISEGVLVEEPDCLVLTQDYTFSSPSTSACVLLGRNSNGRVEWCDERGRTLKQIQEAEIPDTPGQSS